MTNEHGNHEDREVHEGRESNKGFVIFVDFVVKRFVHA
jgi:hypothetical protein